MTLEHLMTSSRAQYSLLYVAKESVENLSMIEMCALFLYLVESKKPTYIMSYQQGQNAYVQTGYACFITIAGLIYLYFQLKKFKDMVSGYPAFACAQSIEQAKSTDRRKHLNLLLHDYSEVDGYANKTTIR